MFSKYFNHNSTTAKISDIFDTRPVCFSSASLPVLIYHAPKSPTFISHPRALPSVTILKLLNSNPTSDLLLSSLLTSSGLIIWTTLVLILDPFCFSRNVSRSKTLQQSYQFTSRKRTVNKYFVPLYRIIQVL